MPFETENYFGSGTRWGVTIQYVLEREYIGIIPALKHIYSRLDCPVLCIPCNIITDLDISALIRSHYNEEADITVAQNSTDNKSITRIQDDLSNDESALPHILSHQALNDLITRPDGLRLKVNSYYSPHALQTVASPADYHTANTRVLNGEFQNIIFPGHQTDKGIWIGNKTRIHPSVNLSPPVVIGNNCQILNRSALGNISVIGNNVIVDEDAQIKNSIIWDDTYIGSHTEVTDSIVRKNYIFNVPRRVNTYVKDNYIIGDIETKNLIPRFERLVNILLASLMLALLSPLIAVLFLYHAAFPSKKFFRTEPRFGAYEITDLSGCLQPQKIMLHFFNSRNRLLRKIPGLVHVIRGDINMVGNSLLSEVQLQSLSKEWTSSRFQTPSGLFHIWEADNSGHISLDERIAAENYYTVTRSFRSDVLILGRCLKSLILNSSTHSITEESL